MPVILMLPLKEVTSALPDVPLPEIATPSFPCPPPPIAPPVPLIVMLPPPLAVCVCRLLKLKLSLPAAVALLALVLLPLLLPVLCRHCRALEAALLGSPRLYEVTTVPLLPLLFVALVKLPQTWLWRGQWRRYGVIAACAVSVVINALAAIPYWKYWDTNPVLVLMQSRFVPALFLN